MKNKKLFLDWEEEETITIGLIKLAQRLPHHEIFFKINQLNRFKFRRVDDFVLNRNCQNYFFPKFECYDCASQNRWVMIANQSLKFEKKSSSLELFDLHEEYEFLFYSKKDFDFVVTSQDGNMNISNIQFPKGMLVEFITKDLEENDELFSYIQE